jgi:pimeloyl-ACP methyl ester carboxylesterase
MYEQLGVRPNGLACGFCVVGNSAGSSQIAYSLGFYGLGDLIDAAVLSGGPPHAYFDRACLNESGWAYPPQFYVNFDASYGFGLRPGPCARHDQSWATRWETNDVIDGAVSFELPTTRVLFIWGELDPTGAEPHQIAYEEDLKRAGSPHVTRIVVPNMTHEITASSAGLNDIEDQLLGT